MLFLAATNNGHKLNELRRIMENMGHQIASLEEVGIAIEVEETGLTFTENALLKANAVCLSSGLATIADDSGLEVDALQGAPGIYSARFSAGGSDKDNREKLLMEMQTVPDDKRSARFVCALAVVMPNGAQLTAEGTCIGKIGWHEQGEDGFGYDSLFILDGKTFAQRKPSEKDQISHRAAALRKLAETLPVFLAAQS